MPVLQCISLTQQASTKQNCYTEDQRPDKTAKLSDVTFSKHSLTKGDAAAAQQLHVQATLKPSRAVTCCQVPVSPFLLCLGQTAAMARCGLRQQDEVLAGMSCPSTSALGAGGEQAGASCTLCFGVLAMHKGMTWGQEERQAHCFLIVFYSHHQSTSSPAV